MISAELSSQTALLLIDRVRSDKSLSDSQRRAAAKLEPLVSSGPALVLGRLQRDARREIPGIPREVPTFDMVRAVTVESYWRYHLKPEVRSQFVTAEDFGRWVDALPEPDRFLLESMSDAEVAVPWDHSWLAEERSLRGLGGQAICDALELEQVPPLVLLHMSASDMEHAGVTVRRPCSLDSVLEPHLQWRPDGPLSGVREFVDGDIPRSVVGRAEWKR